MKITIHPTWLTWIMVVVASLAGCASQSQLTDQQILNQYPQVGQLNAAYEQAGSDNADLLAPLNYAKVGNALQRATTAARNNNADAAAVAVTAGLQSLETLQRDAQSSRELLADVLQKRERAYNAGANALQGQKMAELDRELKATTALVEQGNVEQAKRRRPKLLAGYSQLELIALKQGTIDQAKTAISSAKQQGAAKLAPRTLAQAEDEMALALSILDADRTQTEKANIHATNARRQAQQSAAIAETIKDFNRRDYSVEDVVLWHQQQLSTINAPLGQPLPFNQSNDAVVVGLSKAVSDLVMARDSARSQVQQVEQQKLAQLATLEQQKVAQMAAYKSQLQSTEQQRQKLSQMEQAEQERFETVQAMFSEQEAKVYRQRKNILISVHGFDYPSGQSEIQAANFPLMNKIVQAIKTFPNAHIEVNGHTDAMGNDANNQKLSQARAEKVSQFLMEVGGVDQAKMKARGFGETRPVASNETRAGRAENRRVEVVIVNE